ncbi:hypothetical protein F4680DRAFT_412879 [Xylaria scruposa]|nr:hypothetical protein F4680DRAFT_412879 [Xylaria scruposa]
MERAWIRCTEATSVTTQAVSRPSATNFLEELKLAISGLVLFGAPHDGMEVGALRTAAEGHPSLTLVEEMDPRSSIIKDLKERFTKAIGQLRVISCFEELETPTLRRLDDGTFERDGTKMMMVPERSACLFWPHDSEIRIKIRADHSKIAKLSSTVESKYHIIKDEIAKVADAALRHIPNRFARADICNTMDHICALLDFIDKSMSTSSVGHQLHANLKSLRGTADAVRRTVLDPLLGEVFLGPHKSRDFIATFTTRSNELEAIFFDYDRLALMSDVAYQRYAQFSYHPSTMMSTRMPLMTASETDALLAPRAVQDLCDRASAIMQILIQNFSFSMLHSPVNLDLLKNHTHTQELGLPRIAELQRLFQSEEDFNLTPLGGTLSTSSESGIVVGRWRGGAQATTVIVEYKQYSRSPPATLSADEAQYVTSARLRAQKLVALLQKCSEFSEDPERARSGVGSMTYTFRCLGYLEQLEDRRLAVLYEVPDKYAMQDGQLPGNMLTLKTMIEKGLKVPLEERFHLAVKICSTILNLHSLGWLHKSIRSEHVVVFLSSASKYTKDLPGLPSSYSERCEIYLKGFEFSREVVEKSDPFEVPRDDDLYRHPDRQGVPSVQFTKEYDIYAVGLLLLEIGMGATLAYWAQKLRSKVDKGNNRTTPHGYRLAFIKLAKDNLKNIMGTRYARAVQKCLEGDFGVRMDDKQQTALGIAFQNQVLREIAYGLSL